MPTEIQVRGTSPERFGVGTSRAWLGTPDGAAYVASYWDFLAAQGREYVASDAALGDTVTGQTSLANTTPTFLLRVPTGITAIPSFVNLFQAGSVAGGAITVVMEYDNADRWSSGGTSEGVLNLRTDNPLSQSCTLYSGATATNAAGGFVWGALLGQDVSPAEGAVNGIFLSRRLGNLPMGYLRGPAAWLIYTSAATTGPTWHWSIGWFEIPTTDLPA